MNSIRKGKVEFLFSLFLQTVSLVYLFGAATGRRFWIEASPGPAFFPVILGACLTGASMALLFRTFRNRRDEEVFISEEQIKNLLKSVMPTFVCAVLIAPFGIYVAAYLLVSISLVINMQLSWHRALLVSLLVPAVIYLIFEIALSIRLPKGVFENLL